MAQDKDMLSINPKSLITVQLVYDPDDSTYFNLLLLFFLIDTTPATNITVLLLKYSGSNFTSLSLCTHIVSLYIHLARVREFD